MGVVDTKTFRTGNSVAVRLPKELGFAAGIAVTIERDGTALVLKPKVDPTEDKRRLTNLIAALNAIGPVGEIEVRDADIFPDRPGL